PGSHPPLMARCMTGSFAVHRPNRVEYVGDSLLDLFRIPASWDLDIEMNPGGGRRSLLARAWIVVIGALPRRCFALWLRRRHRLRLCAGLGWRYARGPCLLHRPCCDLCQRAKSCEGRNRPPRVTRSVGVYEGTFDHLSIR